MTAFFSHLRAFGPHKSVVVLHGRQIDPAVLLALNLPIIAVDGAADVLIAENIHPSLILGDLDSLKQKELPYPILHLPNQDKGDFEKTLEHLAQTNLLPAIIIGMSGGFIDHILNNINIFMQSDSLFYDPPIAGHILRKGQLFFPLPLHTKLSIMGMPQAVVSSKGLKWELEFADLRFPGPTSCFNRTVREKVEIEVHEGVAIAMIYLEQIIDAGYS